MNEYSNPTLRLWRRTEARVGVLDMSFWREGYIFEGYDVGNDMIQEVGSRFLIHALSRLEPACTAAQHQKLVQKWQMQESGLSRADFMRSIQPVAGGDGAIAVPWCGMWLCVETDGYCHT